MQRNGLTHRDAGKLGALASKEYNIKQHEMAREKYLASPKICKNCRNIIPYEKRNTAKNFCSQSCAGSFNNRTKIIHNKCKWCAADIIMSKHSYKQQYCNIKCHHAKQWQETKESIILNNSVPNRTCARRYLFEVRGHQCEQCKLTMWNEKPIPLVMDHINGNPYDNSLTNLRLLCCNCDAQTPTYKAKNRGNGRHERRKRYAQGKSF